MGTYETLFIAALGTGYFIAAVGFEESEVADVAFSDEGFGHGFFDYVSWSEGAVALVFYAGKVSGLLEMGFADGEIGWDRDGRYGIWRASIRVDLGRGENGVIGPGRYVPSQDNGR